MKIMGFTVRTVFLSLQERSTFQALTQRNLEYKLMGLFCTQALWKFCTEYVPKMNIESNKICCYIRRIQSSKFMTQINTKHVIAIPLTTKLYSLEILFILVPSSFTCISTSARS